MALVDAVRDRTAGTDEPDGRMLLAIYERMVLARTLSARAFALHRAGLIDNAVPADGHEGTQVGSALAMPRERAIVYPYYRSMAAALAFGMTPYELLLAYFAKEQDPASGGRQMPAHYAKREIGIVTTSSVVATQIPHAVGAAYAAKVRRTGQIAITYFGEGASSQGDFHEALNFAAIHRLPAIFVCENNGFAISVPQRLQMAVASVADRAPGYGLAGISVDGADARAVYRATCAAVRRAEAGAGPTLIEARVASLAPHTTDDDDRGYRDAATIARDKAKRDPLPRLEGSLREAGLLDEARIAAIAARCRAEVNAADEAAQAAADPEAASLWRHVYAETVPPSPQDGEGR